jgi:hypothetical protein
MYAWQVASVQPPAPPGAKAPVASSQCVTRSLKASSGLPWKFIPCTNRKAGWADAVAAKAEGEVMAVKAGDAPEWTAAPRLDRRHSCGRGSFFSVAAASPLAAASAPTSARVKVPP